MNTDVGNGVTELIAACGFNASANPVGPDSFTRALITELRLLSDASLFSVGTLYNRILCRVANWMPHGRELQKPPLHVVLTQNKQLPQSIHLSPLCLPFSGHSSPAISSSNHRSSPQGLPEPDLSERDPLSNSTCSNQSSHSEPFRQNSSHSPPSLPSSDRGHYPRIALTIRLKETLSASELSEDLFADWLRMMPVLAEHVKVEAGFASFSTLLVISVPVAIWCYIPDHIAIAVIGLITSTDLVSETSASLDQTPSNTWKISSEAGSKQPAMQQLSGVVSSNHPNTYLLAPAGKLSRYCILCFVFYFAHRSNSENRFRFEYKDCVPTFAS